MLDSRTVLDSQWNGTQSRQIAKRIVVEAELVLDTPAHFGSGDSDGIELLILEDALERRPLLPGASIAGALRHYLLRRERGYRAAEDNTTLAAFLFGEAYQEERGTQSRVIVDDALGANPNGPLLAVRDGVKIDGATRTADEGALFSFQVWTPGTRFAMRFELHLYADDLAEEEFIVRGLMTALKGLDNGDVQLGARKHRGYGRVHVENWRAHAYDLREPAGLINWIRSGDPEWELPLAVEWLALPDLEDARQFVRVGAHFELNDSLLIRAGSDATEMAFLSYADGAPVLSGTSVTGALRARALKIGNTFNPAKAQDLINDMFGAHGDERDAERQASRLIISEEVIRGANTNWVQSRVKIDRFTGGAFETALFEQQPVFATGETQIVIHMELRCPAAATDMTNAEIGLLFLLLKDLWTSDLPLGGASSVGRGRLTGEYADIHIQRHDQNAQIVLDANQALPEDVRLLEQYVAAFVNWIEG